MLAFGTLCLSELLTIVSQFKLEVLPIIPHIQMKHRVRRSGTGICIQSESNLVAVQIHLNILEPDGAKENFFSPRKFALSCVHPSDFYQLGGTISSDPQVRMQ